MVKGGIFSVIPSMLFYCVYWKKFEMGSLQYQMVGSELLTCELLANLYQDRTPSSNFQARICTKMSSYSKKFVASFIRDYIGPYSQPKSIVKLFDTSLQEVKVQAMSPYDTYTTISINPYTLEERLNTYQVVPLSGYGLEAVVVHSSPPLRCPYVVINVE